jgi:DNA-binding CsgD family transcriptional regulator
VISLPRTRLLARLDPAIPLMLVEGGAGNHKYALLHEWAETPSPELRVVVDFDPRQQARTSMADQLGYRLQLAGVPLPTDAAVAGADGTITRPLEAAVRVIDRPLALVVHRLDEIPAEAARALVELAGRLSGFRLLATAADAYDLVGMAVAAGVGYEVVEDTLLAYTEAEVAELLARELPTAGKGSVRAVMVATRGNPALVERTIELFGPEVLAGTVTSEQAFWGWLPERNGPEPYRDALRMLAQAPRFGPALLHCLFGDQRGDYLLERMRRQVGEFVTTPAPVFTWTPALRRQWRRWYAAQPAEQIEADRARLAECAQRTGDIELALLMLLGSHRLDQATQLADDWLWELGHAGPDLLWDALASLDPDVLAARPALLALLSRLGTRRGEPAADPGVARAQRTLLEGRAGGSTPAQLDRLAKVAVVALGIGDVGVAIRACVRWVASARSGEVAAALSPALVSDALLVTGTLFQLGRVDLAAQVAVQFLPELRRNPGAAGGHEDARRAALWTLWTAASAVLGSSRAEGGTPPADASLDRPLDSVARALQRAWDALDRGDLDTADAVTQVAFTRLEEPADWPMLVAHRIAVLLARGEGERASEEFASHVRPERWRTRQQHPEASSWWAVLAELMLARSPGRADIRSVPELAEFVRSLPRGALPRWCAGGREIVELAVLARGAGDAALLAAADAALPTLPPRARWNLALLAAPVRLRSGEESAAVQGLLAAGAVLKHPSAPIALALAGRDEIATLDRLLPASAPRPVRDSLALALGYAGRPGGRQAGPRLAGRELEVLDGVRRGLTNAAIARELFVSVNTVKFHRTNLYRKLGANSRGELLAEALRLGL